MGNIHFSSRGVRKKTGSIYRRRLITKTDPTQLYQKLRWRTGTPSRDEVRAALHPTPQRWALPKLISDVSLSLLTEKPVKCSLFRIYFLNANITDSCRKFQFLIGDLIVNTKTHKHILLQNLAIFLNTFQLTECRL